MKTWLENRWSALRTNFWFLPGVMALLAVALCTGFLYLDNRLADRIFPLMQAGSPEGVRTLLGVLIGALVTTVSIVFSTTVVVLTLAASQLGPRLLRTYVRDRSNQLLLGVFVATLFYCLTAMFVVGRLEGAGGLPDLTVLGAFLLTCASLIVLVYFIHHVAVSIQAPNVILAVAAELRQLIERTYPAARRDPAPNDAASREAASRQQPELPDKHLTVPAKVSGYVQAVDEDGLLASAMKYDKVIRMMHRPGHFVLEGQPLALLYDARLVEGSPESAGTGEVSGRDQDQSRRQGPDQDDLKQEASAAAETVSQVRSRFIMGPRRTTTQDVEFVLMELVEIAVRSLSPGINDPFTAMTCIDRIAEALRLVAGRRLPSDLQYDEQGSLRLIVSRNSFQGLCDAAFNQIRQNAGREPAVLIRLLEGLYSIAERAGTERKHAVVELHARMVRRAALGLPERKDREDVEERFKKLASAFGYSPEDE
ncbi:MAG: DUF2254 domain-containing protein [Spirochaetota bacterium]